MAFSSIIFLVYFLPVFLLLLEILPGKWIKPYILIASVLFYQWGAPLFLFALIGVSIINFYLVKWLSTRQTEKSRKLTLVLSLVINLGILFYFKYFNFFTDIYQTMLGWLSVTYTPEHMDIALPIGISFFTFESLTYIIDVYRREQQPLKQYWEYQLYIIYFPKLIAGPIVRYRDIAHQIHPTIQPAAPPDKIQGLLIFMIGLCKKVLIANTLAPVADRLVTIAPYAHTTETVWLGVLAYTFQIYFDFSGYSDMAIGLSRIIGIRLLDNFDNPYASYSITGFWKKWHMSMTSWFRNYLYIPLGGNRGSRFKTYRNLVIVFLLSGLWHGASWNYILWGGYHGFWLVMERVALGKMIHRIRWLWLPATFLIVAVGWLFFKVENIDYAFILFKKMFFIENFSMSMLYTNVYIGHDFIAALTLAALFSFSAVSTKVLAMQDRIYSGRPTARMAPFIVILCICIYITCLSFITAGSFNPFIYFRF
jgi:alginate O-acetyltransferase complex protein AlgI